MLAIPFLLNGPIPPDRILVTYSFGIVGSVINDLYAWCYFIVKLKFSFMVMELRILHFSIFACLIKLHDKELVDS